MKQNQVGKNKAMEARWSSKESAGCSEDRKDRLEFMLCVRDLPDDPWVRPAGDSAMQPHTLLLPHGVGARFNHKLRGVH